MQPEGLLEGLPERLLEALPKAVPDALPELLPEALAHQSAIASQQSKKGGRRQEAEGP